MAAPKGHARYGGRKKGTPNKRSEAFDERYDELCEKHKLDPFEVLFKLCSSTEEPSIRLQAAKELCQYRYAKRKAVEISGPEKGSLDVNVTGVNEIVQEFKKMAGAYASERDKS